MRNFLITHFEIFYNTYTNIDPLIVFCVILTVSGKGEE